jgi:hypothetical protein
VPKNAADGPRAAAVDAGAEPSNPRTFEPSNRLCVAGSLMYWLARRQRPGVHRVE